MNLKKIAYRAILTEQTEATMDFLNCLWELTCPCSIKCSVKRPHYLRREYYKIFKHYVQGGTIWTIFLYYQVYNFALDLIFSFNMKKSATEAHRMLLNTYGEVTISERTCREWFQRLNGDFDVEKQHGGGRGNVFEDAELEALLELDSCQTQQELAGSMRVTQQVISKRLNALK